MPYLSSQTAIDLFQNLVWGPLISIKTPQNAGMPQQWDDLDGSIAGFIATDPEGKGAAGPDFGVANTRRIRINGPSTHRFMEIIEQDYWANFTPHQQSTLRALFGDANDSGGTTSFFLWFDF